jgi:hypothetical protein
MDEATLHAAQRRDLGSLRDAVTQLGYDARIIERSADMPYHTLVVDLPPIDDGEAPYQLGLTFYPIADEEFAGTRFLQYFISLPATPTAATRAGLLELAADINNRLVVGSVGLTQGNPAQGGGLGQAHFRYVQALRSDEPITAERVGDVLVLVAYSIRLFDAALAGVADGSLTVDAARAQIVAAYS